MARLQFKTSPDPQQNIRWGLRHACYGGVFALVVLALNQTGLMQTAYPIVKAVLILGLLINLLYFCGYIMIAGVRYLGKLYASQKK